MKAKMILASMMLVLALTLLALALMLQRLTIDSMGVHSPVTIGTGGNTELYLGYVEILDHCVNWDELLDCAEFEHASKLNARDCDLAIGSAHLMCIVIGAPVSESVFDYLLPPQRR